MIQKPVIIVNWFKVANSSFAFNSTKEEARITATRTMKVCIFVNMVVLSLEIWIGDYAKWIQVAS
jgi:hypothetical protein